MNCFVFFLLVVPIFRVNAQYLLQLRVIGGTPTSINQYPIIAQLLLDVWGNQDFQQYCAGVILTRRHVLSTAHCFQVNMATGRNYTLPYFWKIRVGSSHRSRGGMLHNLKTIIPHHSFDKYYYTNDIAVVVVEKPFVLGPDVRQATITKYGSEVKPDSLCVLIGWGALGVDGPQPDQLQHAKLYSIDQSVCTNRYSMIRAVIADSMMCAGFVDVGGADGCNGDSGGPLIYKGVVVGLVSFGYGCGDRFYPGVYTKLSHFTDWILTTIANKS